LEVAVAVTQQNLKGAARENSGGYQIELSITVEVSTL
jgi:hypothetical protein